MSGPERVYAIGDVHGRLDLLREVHDAIADDLAAAPVAAHAVVHIGDFVDRGPDSAGVISFLQRGEDEGHPWVNLLGNHDRMFLRYLAAPGGRDARLRSQFWWLHERIGGAETLRSYGIAVRKDPTEEDGRALHQEARAAVPALHFAFLAGLRRFWRWRGWYFAHAGVRPGVALADQVEDDLIWIRDEFLASTVDHGAVVVHGHTPVAEVEDHGVRIAIDTGAGYDGPLACVALEAAGGARVLGGPRLR